MVAETGRYRSSSSSTASSFASNSRVPGASTRPPGKYGSTYASYTSESESYSSPGASHAPVVGRVRITQSVERNVSGIGSGIHPGTQGFTAASHSRRYSISTDKPWTRDKSMDLYSDVGARASAHSPTYSYPRRASVSTTLSKSQISQKYYTGDDGSYDTSDSIGIDGISSFPSHYHYHGPSSFSQRGHTRSSSVSKYDSQTSLHQMSRREPSLTRYEGQDGRGPSIPRYDSQSSLGRAPSVSRYDTWNSLARSPSMSRYDSQSSLARAPSVTRYEGEYVYTRAPSIPRYDSQGSFARSSSVSRYEGQGGTSFGKRFRSASVSRFDRQASLDVSEGFFDMESDYPSRGRATSVTHGDSTVASTPVDSGAVDNDADYQLRRQLRALRNQQIRSGSVTRSHDRTEQVVHHHHPQHHPQHHHHQQHPEKVVPLVIRPRSLSTSSHHREDRSSEGGGRRRRYRVLTVQSPARTTPSPSNPPVITGYPEPTLYSAKVFRTKGSHSTSNESGSDISVSNTEMGFVDHKEDLTSYVLQPGEKFLPTDVSVSILPSGKKAVTYTRFSQTGHGDQRTANEEIDRIVRKTKSLQDSMHTLEDFVKRNRSLFPEDIIIYQKIIFYLLSEEELIKMGERPDAEVYGVKIRERLIAPVGTDVASILRKYYSRHHEVDVEYEHPELIRRRLKLAAESGGDLEFPAPKGKRFDDELDLKRAGSFPQSWFPSRRSGSKDQSLHIDEEELMRRSPRMQPVRPTAPEFIHRLRRQKAVIGQSIRLSCSVSAYPDARITWYRGKQEITENGRFSIKNQSGLCTLTIADVTADDAALYTVRAANSEGEASTSALLEVYDIQDTAGPRPLRKRSSEPISAAGLAVIGGGGGGISAGRRPFYLLEARNLWADVGERAVFEVQAAGKPLPSFTWVKDESVVTEDDHIQIISDGYGNCKLIIREIKGTDFGTYRCQAQNEEGTVESIASLFCIGNESVRPGDALRNELRTTAGQHKGRKPQFVHVPPSRIDVLEGESLTLQCAVDGDPKPQVTWYKGVRELTYTGRHRVLEERNNCYVMQLKSTLATDSGQYTVTAHNLCGIVEYVVYVNVLPVEQKIDDFDTSWKRPDLTPVEFELVTKKRQGKMPPIFVKKLPREKQMKVGASLKLDCYVEASKPREYLVDVDIVRKETKPEDAVRQKPESLKKETSLRSQPAAPTMNGAAIYDGLDRTIPKMRTSPEPKVFQADTSPSFPEDGIAKLAENLSKEISAAAVEEARRKRDLESTGGVEGSGKDDTGGGKSVVMEKTAPVTVSSEPTEVKMVEVTSSEVKGEEVEGKILATTTHETQAEKKGTEKEEAVSSKGEDRQTTESKQTEGQTGSLPPQESISKVTDSQKKKLQEQKTEEEEETSSSESKLSSSESEGEAD